MIVAKKCDNTSWSSSGKLKFFLCLKSYHNTFEWLILLGRLITRCISSLQLAMKDKINPLNFHVIEKKRRSLREKKKFRTGSADAIIVYFLQHTGHRAVGNSWKLLLRARSFWATLGVFLQVVNYFFFINQRKWKNWCFSTLKRQPP